MGKLLQCLCIPDTPTDVPQSPVRYPLFDVLPHILVSYMHSDNLIFLFQKLSRDQTLRVRVWQKRPAGTPKRICWLDPVRMTPTSLSRSMILWPAVTTHSALPKVRGGKNKGISCLYQIIDCREVTRGERNGGLHATNVCNKSRQETPGGNLFMKEKMPSIPNKACKLQV